MTFDEDWLDLGPDPMPLVPLLDVVKSAQNGGPWIWTTRSEPGLEGGMARLDVAPDAHNLVGNLEALQADPLPMSAYGLVVLESFRHSTERSLSLGYKLLHRATHQPPATMAWEVWRHWASGGTGLSWAGVASSAAPDPLPALHLPELIRLWLLLREVRAHSTEPFVTLLYIPHVERMTKGGARVLQKMLAVMAQWRSIGYRPPAVLLGFRGNVEHVRRTVHVTLADTIQAARAW